MQTEQAKDYAMPMHLSLRFCCMLVLAGINGTIGLQKCYDTGYFTANSTYAKNLDLILSYLPGNASENGGFYNTTIGDRQGVDKVYAFALCRGDVSSEDCSTCVSSRAGEIKAKCPNETSAILREGGPCLVRYSDQSFFGIMETDPILPLHNTVANVEDVTSNVTKFYETWDTLMARLMERAASNETSRLKFATGIADVEFRKIHALMQCTPDISQTDCKLCLIQTVNAYQSCCRKYQGGPVVTPSCFFRWDLYSFFITSNYTLYLNLDLDLSPPPPPPPPPPDSTTNKNTTTTTKGDEGVRKKLVISLTTISCITIILGILVYCLHQKRLSNKPSKLSSMFKVFHLAAGNETSRTFLPTNTLRSQLEVPEDQAELAMFDLHRILVATDNFSIANKLGQGGFGPVYKGKLHNGKQVAVKRLSSNSGQGIEEFKNEVMLISKLQHRNLVRLFGYCTERDERLLIYEFMANKSLDSFLFDPTKRAELDWPKRFNIIQGVMRGLLYLHRDSCLRVIHRDLKVSNILLDDNMNPKISDFGLARIFQGTQLLANTHRVVGTLGYMSPEYALSGIFSEKSDVFSFGVLLLEIVSGRKITTSYCSDKYMSLVSNAWQLWSEGKELNLLDERLAESSFSSSEVKRCIHVALLCVQDHAEDRPNMPTIVSMFSSEAKLPQPKQPTFTFQTTLYSDRSNSNHLWSPFEITESVLEGR